MIFDKSSFICRLENDELLEREIIALFLGQCPHLLEEIRQAASQRDATKLERAAHTLKGSLGDMAAPCAFDAARALEDMGRKRSLDGSEKALYVLQESLRRLEHELRHFEDSTEPKARDTFQS
jgi:two-component system sensor histidine kinase/response regulator